MSKLETVTRRFGFAQEFTQKELKNAIEVLEFDVVNYNLKNSEDALDVLLGTIEQLQAKLRMAHKAYQDLAIAKDSLHEAQLLVRDAMQYIDDSSTPLG